MKVREAIEKINNGKYYSLFDIEEEVLEGCGPVAKGLEVDKHCWYEVSTRIYKMEDGYVGVTGVTGVPQACGNMNCLDCYYLATASECEEFQTISYRRKK